MTARISRLFARAKAGAGPCEDHKQESGASTGQIMIMFAFFITAMLGVLGLAIDLGYAYSQRRTVQSAADLAAVAGARQIARYQKDGGAFESTSAGPDIRSIVTDNHMKDTVTELEACYYIDLGGFPQSDENDPAGCDGTIPPNATGVYVRVSETHSTFFMRAIPGAPVYVTTGADATAQVERLDLAGMDSPFILCGYHTKWVDEADAEIDKLDLLLSDYVVNPAAIGETFQLSGTTGANDIEKCSANGPFKTWHGLADKRANQGKRVVLAGASTSTWWNPMIGLASIHASTVTNKVSGIDGCAELASTPYDCIMMIPIAPEYTGGSLRRFKVTKVMAFDVRRDDANANIYWGTLIDDYLVFGASVPSGVDQAPWCRDCGSVVVVRLAS